MNTEKRLSVRYTEQGKNDFFLKLKIRKLSMRQLK